jgi:ElaB/YqjD/DUF883 family membrane-anchored ribosome-binding protein
MKARPKGRISGNQTRPGWPGSGQIEARRRPVRRERSPAALAGNRYPQKAVLAGEVYSREEKMDKQWAQEVAKNAAEKGDKSVGEAVQRAEPEVRPTLDQGKSMVQDLANRASEAGTQAIGQASEFVEGFAPQAKQMASNLYDQGSQSGENVRQYAAQHPLPALLIAGAIGFSLGYLIHRT